MNNKNKILNNEDFITINELTASNFDQQKTFSSIFITEVPLEVEIKEIERKY